jgi:hypothetical protein
MRRRRRRGGGVGETVGDGHTAQIGPQGLKSEHDGRRGRGGIDAGERMQSSACSPGHPSLPLEVMSNALAIDDGHPLALELQSLRTTVAKYQVCIVVSFAS